jgi:hypothetical protein
MAYSDVTTTSRGNAKPLPHQMQAGHASPPSRSGVSHPRNVATLRYFRLLRATSFGGSDGRPAVRRRPGRPAGRTGRDPWALLVTAHPTGAAHRRHGQQSGAEPAAPWKPQGSVRSAEPRPRRSNGPPHPRTGQASSDTRRNRSNRPSQRSAGHSRHTDPTHRPWTGRGLRPRVRTSGAVRSADRPGRRSRAAHSTRRSRR